MTTQFAALTINVDASRRLAGVFAALIAGDIATTVIGLSLGGVEANPLGPVLAIAAKIAAVTLAFLLICFQVPRWRNVTAAPIVIALSLPVVWNIAQLAGLAA
jgi:hypothetical protein